MKKLAITFLYSFCFATIALAQEDFALQYANTITQEELKEHLTYIASDKLEGRETGTAGQYLAARYIADEFQKLGLERIVPLGEYKSYFQWFNVYRNGKRQKLAAAENEKPENYEEAVASMNVMGYLEGSSKKEEVLVISAHYDHLGIGKNGAIHNGADDDGSGTVAVLELAEAFVKAKKNGHGPERSILFLLVAGEEKGLLGSRYFTDFNPIIPLERIVCNLNIDMIGRQDEHHKNDEYVYLIGADKLSSELHDLSIEANEKYINFELDYTYNNEADPNRFYYRSDHYNFAKNNIPVIFFFTGVHEDYHKPSDIVDKILFPKYCKITQLVFYTAWDITNRELRLQLDSNEN